MSVEAQATKTWVQSPLHDVSRVPEATPFAFVEFFL
jgi:hypothetical protein